MKKTSTVNRIATSAVALVCAGFVGMSYASGQTARPITSNSPGRVIDLTQADFPEPPDDNLAEQAREVTKVVRKLLEEGRGLPGNDGSNPFPGVF